MTVFAWVVTGRVTVEFDSGRRAEYNWRLRYESAGPDAAVPGRLVLRDLVGVGPDALNPNRYPTWDWSGRSDDGGVTWY